MRRKPATDSIITITAIAALALSCDLPPSFGPEYQDSTVNFIAALPLAAPPPATDHGLTVPPDVALDALATWDWAWRGNAGPANNFEYMVLTDQGAGTGPGGIGNAWLMETVNLAGNSTFAGPSTAGWASSGATLSGIAAIHASALSATFTDPADFIYIDDTFFSDQPPAEAHSYLLSMNAMDIEGLRWIETPILAYDANELQLPGWTGPGPYTLRFTNVIEGTNRYLSLSRTINPLKIDDVTAMRIDVSRAFWSLVLRLSAADTIPTLVPGTYEFSVYVRVPGGYLFSTDPARGDDPDYATRFVTLRMLQTSTSGTRAVAEESFDLTALPAGWNRLVLRMEPGSNFTFPETTPGQLVELSISGLHLDENRTEPGAVLIAEPSLNFYINGY